MSLDAQDGTNDYDLETEVSRTKKYKATAKKNRAKPPTPREKKRMTTAASILTKKPHNLMGSSPFAIFHLDGDDIVVTHMGDHIEIRGQGKFGVGSIAISPLGGNSVSVRPDR